MRNETVFSTYFPGAGRLADGRLAFVVEGGLVIFSPEELLTGVTAPKVAVLRVRGPAQQLFEKGSSAGMPTAAGQDRDLVVPASASPLLQFEFTGWDFAFPERLRFSYRLRGVSDEWSELRAERRAFFPHLPPRDYVFEVKAVDYHNAESPEPAALAFTVRPYYHQTWLFRGGVVVALGGLVVGLHRRRVRIRERIKDLEKRVELDRERSRIARDMHDEIGTSLAQIRLLGELARDFGPNSPKQEETARQIANLAQGSSRSLREIIWALNPSKDQYAELADYLATLVADHLDGTNVEPDLRFPPAAAVERIAFSPTFRREIIRIVKGILSNVVKHSNASRFILEMRHEGDRLLLLAEDNGKGFDPTEVRSDSHGLESIRERVGELGGRLSIDAAPGEGARLRIELPVDQA
jgi:signal transduction histidine kinase